MVKVQRPTVCAAAVMRRERLLDGLEKRFMTLRLHTEVMIHADLGPVRQKGPSDGVAPDQRDFRPGELSTGRNQPSGDSYGQ